MAATIADSRLVKLAEAVCCPLSRHDVAEQRHSGERDEQREHEPVLELESRPQPLEERVLLADEVDAECAGAQPEPDCLHAEEDEQAAEDQGVDCRGRGRGSARSRNTSSEISAAGNEHDSAGEEEEEVGL